MSARRGPAASGGLGRLGGLGPSSASRSSGSGRALGLRLGVVRGTALRGDRDEDVGSGVRLPCRPYGVGLGEGLGLHGGDLQDDRC